MHQLYLWKIRLITPEICRRDSPAHQLGMWTNKKIWQRNFRIHWTAFVFPSCEINSKRFGAEGCSGSRQISAQDSPRTNTVQYGIRFAVPDTKFSQYDWVNYGFRFRWGLSKNYSWPSVIGWIRWKAVNQYVRIKQNHVSRVIFRSSSQDLVNLRGVAFIAFSTWETVLGFVLAMGETTRTNE